MLTCHWPRCPNNRGSARRRPAVRRGHKPGGPQGDQRLVIERHWPVQCGFLFSLSATDVGNGVNEASSLRADLVGNPYPPGFVKNTAHWFNNAAFLTPLAGNFGNSSRNLLRGPGIAALDTSIFKTTKFERLELQLRFESFNVLNHPVFSNPNTSVTVAAARESGTDTHHLLAPPPGSSNDSEQPRGSE